VFVKHRCPWRQQYSWWLIWSCVSLPQNFYCYLYL